MSGRLIVRRRRLGVRLVRPARRVPLKRRWGRENPAAMSAMSELLSATEEIDRAEQVVQADALAEFREVPGDVTEGHALHVLDQREPPARHPVNRRPTHADYKGGRKRDDIAFLRRWKRGRKRRGDASGLHGQNSVA